jgi:hypothetical protein
LKNNSQGKNRTDLRSHPDKNEKCERNEGFEGPHILKEMKELRGPTLSKK